MKENLLNVVFYPPDRKNSPGAPRLDVILRDPSANQSDGDDFPVRVSMRIAACEDSSEISSFSHPWLYGESQQVCAGMMKISTNKKDNISAFTFGGELDIDTGENSTTLSLHSSAPILRLEDFNSIPTILANEVAILLGERRADELPHMAPYERHLVCVDPLTLYCACLKKLKAKFSEITHTETPSLSLFYIFLETEIDSLERENLWPDNLQDLEALL
ncbi:MAG: hypothetical protein ACK2U3_16755 [Anaerolineales bacterium]|jgi:hypothetical protein